MVLSKKSNKKNSGKRSMQKTRKGGKKSKMTSKKTGKKGTKKGKGGKKGKKQFRKMSRKNQKKGGELTMTDPPSPGDCVKKGTFGLHQYEVVEVNPSDGYGMPTILVKDSNEEYERHNLPDMVRCNLKTKMYKEP